MEARTGSESGLSRRSIANRNEESQIRARACKAITKSADSANSGEKDRTRNGPAAVLQRMNVLFV